MKARVKAFFSFTSQSISTNRCTTMAPSLEWKMMWSVAVELTLVSTAQWSSRRLLSGCHVAMTTATITTVSTRTQVLISLMVVRPDGVHMVQRCKNMAPEYLRWRWSITESRPGSERMEETSKSKQNLNVQLFFSTLSPIAQTTNLISWP